MWLYDGWANAYWAYPSRRYYCYGQTLHLEAPCRKSVSADTVEQKVWEILWNNLLSDPAYLSSYLEQKRQNAQQAHAELTHIQQRLISVSTELEALAVKQQRLLDLYLDGRIDQQLFATNKTSLDASREQLEFLREELQARLRAEDSKQEQVDHAISFVQNLADDHDLSTESIKERRDVLTSLGVYVVCRSLDSDPHLSESSR